jgi:phenylalanyl-tRNA synthetase beta chain
MNSINNIVDCTNYVMMELGQPLHAFDASQIRGRKIVVERAQAGEPFVTLDGTELHLTGEELMIKDVERSVCIAGVIGGKNSGVTDATTEVFLESAYFSPLSARKSLRAHGLNTDSGYRFARGVDPEGTLKALDRASELILKVAGGEAFAQNHDFYPTPQKKEVVSLKVQTISDRLGYAAVAKKFEDFMQRLGCSLEKVNEGEYKILPPSYRFDLELDMDLVEEYARLNGYDQIPETIPVVDLVPTAHDGYYVLQRRVSELMRAQGFSQALHSTFVGTKTQNHFLKSLQTLQAAGLKTTEMAVKVLNPLNEEQDCLRQSLSFGLYRNITQNFHQGNETGRLFEIGKVFLHEGPAQYQENWRLGLSAWGMIQGLWQKEAQHPVVFELKAAVEALLRSFNINSYQWASVVNKGEVPAFLHRGQVAHLVVEGKKVGFIGSVHPVLLEDDKIRVPAALAELDLEVLFKTQPRLKRSESLSRFPSVRRDLALVMAKTLKVGQVSEVIRKEAGPYLVGLDVFDVYEGDKLEAGQKSVAFALNFQDKKDTLRDQVVNESVDQVLRALKEKFQISVR